MKFLARRPRRMFADKKRGCPRVTPKEHRERPEALAKHKSGEYLLAPCCVLFAAIHGTRAAYDWAMDLKQSLMKKQTLEKT